MIFAVVLAPWLLRLGYSERLIPALNEVFSGREIHSVDFYLDAWRSVAMAATAALLLLAAGVMGWMLVPEAPRRDLIDRLLGGADGLTPLEIVRASVAAGLVAGLGEAAYLSVRNEVTHRPAALWHVETWWMAPASAAFVALLIGCAIAVLALGGRRRLALRTAAVVFGFMVIHSVIQSDGIPLYPAAEVVLSLGLATVFSRLVMSRERLALRLVRRSGMLIVLGLGAIASTAWLLLPASIEARALRSLPAAASGLPNIIVIIIDTARAANFSLHGYARSTSPVLDDWSRSGVVFDRAVATSSWTLPSHASLFTGQANHILGVGADQPLPESYTTLAEALRDVGYQTGGFAANSAYTTAASGLAQGFARYEDRPWEMTRVLQSSWLSRLIFEPLAFGPFPRLVPLNAPRGDYITDHFLTWAQDRDERRPFFAFLNYFDAHEPYILLPAEQAARFGEVPEDYWPEFKERFYEEGDTAGLDLWVNRYDASIAYVDSEIGRIRSWLSESGALDNTIVIVTADHGEMWGEHGELSHAQSLFVPLVHIPMLVWYPSVIPEGLRVDDVVSLVDVPRTIFDLLPIDAPPEFGGSSLTPLWSDVGDRFTRYALAELWQDDPNPPRNSLVRLGPMKSLIDGRYQFIRLGDGSELLFDLELDYEQFRNLGTDPEHADDLARFRSALDSLGGRW
jgi:arylsulfatase A-like enzyme